MALLLACVRAARGTEGNDNASRAAWTTVDWPRLMTMALGHGVMPHLHVGLKHLAVDVPKVTRDELHQQFRDNAQSNLFRAGELLRLLALFDEHGIQAVPLKGPVLAMSLWGNLAMRQFTDLDLLISPQEASRAEKLLLSRGYEVRSSCETSITAVRTGGLCPLVVDLQWTFAEDRYSFPLNAGEVRRRLVVMPFMSTTVRQPALDDQLLILSVHPAKHCWSKLEWVVDMAAFIRAFGARIDWRAALDRAGHLGARRLLLLAVGLTEHLLRLPAPIELREGIRSDRIGRRLALEISESLCNSPTELNRLNGSYGLVEAGLLYIRTRERFSDKVPYLRFFARLFRQWCSLTPNDRDYAVVALPRYLHPLYFAIRPVRLLWKYGFRLLRSGLQTAGSLR